MKIRPANIRYIKVSKHTKMVINVTTALIYYFVDMNIINILGGQRDTQLKSLRKEPKMLTHNWCRSESWIKCWWREAQELHSQLLAGIGLEQKTLHQRNHCWEKSQQKLKHHNRKDSILRFRLRTTFATRCYNARNSSDW